MKKNKPLIPVGTRMKNSQQTMRRICIACPTTGLMRVEFVMSRFGCIIPVNWSNGDIFQYFDQCAPLEFVVADAKNICAEYSLSNGFEWTFYLDHDVCLPPDTFIKLNQYMMEDKWPVVSGLYYCKASVPEPLLFRGRGNSYYPNWKFGDKVEVDAVPMGCTLIHNSVLRALQEISERYTIKTKFGDTIASRIFETPRKAWLDPEQGKYNAVGGTEDIFWCDRVMDNDILIKAGWNEIAKKKYPFLLDTSIFCQHIDSNGLKYPGILYRETKQYKGSKLQKLERKGYGHQAKSAGSQY